MTEAGWLDTVYSTALYGGPTLSDSFVDGSADDNGGSLFSSKVGLNQTRLNTPLNYPALKKASLPLFTFCLQLGLCQSSVWLYRLSDCGLGPASGYCMF